MKKMFRFASILALMLVALTTFAQDENNLQPGSGDVINDGTGTGDLVTPEDVSDIPSSEDLTPEIDPETGLPIGTNEDPTDPTEDTSSDGDSTEVPADDPTPTLPDGENGDSEDTSSETNGDGTTEPGDTDQPDVPDEPVESELP